jgi:hypothetical protein
VQQKMGGTRNSLRSDNASLFIHFLLHITGGAEADIPNCSLRIALLAKT